MTGRDPSGTSARPSGPDRSLCATPSRPPARRALIVAASLPVLTFAALPGAWGQERWDRGAEVPIPFPELEVQAAYDDAGYVLGWDAQAWLRSLDPEVADLMWDRAGSIDLRDRFLAPAPVSERPNRADLTQIVRVFRDAYGPLHRASTPSAKPAHQAEHGEAYFQYWRDYGNRTADVLESRPVHRDEFDPFVDEFMREYQRLQQYLSLMWETYSRKVQCAEGSPAYQWTCDETWPRFSGGYGTVATTFQVYPSEIFWAYGVDPWAYMEEIAATSRPSPLGSGPRETVALRFVVAAGAATEPAGELVHGQPFRVEAKFGTAPGRDSRIVTLDWRGGSLEVTLDRTADPSVYRSAVLVIEPSSPLPGAGIEP